MRYAPVYVVRYEDPYYRAYGPRYVYAPVPSPYPVRYDGRDGGSLLVNLLEGLLFSRSAYVAQPTYYVSTPGYVAAPPSYYGDALGRPQAPTFALANITVDL